MIDRLNVAECSLCGSCRQICPTQAITYTKRDRDFSYPEINPQACIQCNQCEKACPVLNPHDESTHTLKKSFIGRNRDMDVRTQSTSGGIFYAIARKFIENGGMVAGVVLDSDYKVKHILSDQVADVERMMGSKYANTDAGAIFPEIFDALHQERKVLFTGCPCQIAGIRSYLLAKKEKLLENLYLVELVCHGIPSQFMLDEYLKLHCRKSKSKIKRVRFRDKTDGWHYSSVCVEYENGKVYRKPIIADAYMKGYFSGMTMKESCYDCKFRNFKAGSDLLFGDFWGAEIEEPELDDNTGLSAVIVNSEKGIELLDNDLLDCREYDLDTIIKYNQTIVTSLQKHSRREDFYRFAEENGYAEAIDKFLWETKSEESKRKLRFRLRTVKHLITGKGKTLY